MKAGVGVGIRFIVAWCAAALLCAGASNARAFGFEDVAATARALADAPYRPSAAVLPQALRDLDYDALRDIRFRPERALWRAEKLPFELMFFHLGRNFQEPVRISTVEPGGVKRLEFDPSSFDYGKNRVDPTKWRGLGFAGFRVHYAINKPAYKDEVAVFLGASYFRAVGQGQIYGLSARGLAVDTAAPSGEEFPRFTEYWIERPRAGATALTLYALLESKRVAGAYRFVIAPGTETVMQVTARLYPREAIAKLGIAPLNSMYSFGENQPGGHDDYRPEVHDSDGLSIANGNGEWYWRPLVNPKRLLVTSFGAQNPKGFGLMQRDRSAASFEDTEAQYERRPSAWVEPLGSWGAGRVELVQIPTPDETNDNIVAYWVADRPVEAKQPLNVAYRLHWQMPGQLPVGRAWVAQTRRGRGYVKNPDGDLNFVVDWDAAAIAPRGAKAPPALGKGSPPPPTGVEATRERPAGDLKSGDAPPEAVVDVGGNAQLREKNLFRNPVSGAWRMTVRIRREDAAKPVEMRGQLRQAGQPVSEYWSYIVPPESEKP